MSRTEVGPIGMADLGAVVDVHCAAFPDSLLTIVGSEAVRRYYAWQLTGPHKLVVALGVKVDGVLAGFCFAGVYYGALSGFIRNNRAYLIARVAMRPYLLFKPAFREKFRTGLRILSKVGRKKQAAVRPAPIKVRPFGILSIAVSPAVRGSGAALELERACGKIAREMGYSEMMLTVAPENVRAIRFYEKNGWTRILEGAQWNGRMRKALAQETRPHAAGG